MSGRDASSIPALVPMRERSERIPGKNLRSLAGRPLCEWIVETLVDAELVRDVVVNTDSEEIARRVEPLGARILWRPTELRGSMVDIRPLLRHDLRHVDGEVFLQTHCTNPLLRSDTVDHAIRAYFDRPEFDCLASVTRLQTRLYDSDRRPINHDPADLKRTQDLDPIFEENSCIYIFSRSTFEEFDHRLGARPQFFQIERLEAVDIDEEADFMVADALMRARIAGDPDAVEGS